MPVGIRLLMVGTNEKMKYQVALGYFVVLHMPIVAAPPKIILAWTNRIGAKYARGWMGAKKEQLLPFPLHKWDGRSAGNFAPQESLFSVNYGGNSILTFLFEFERKFHFLVLIN